MITALSRSFPLSLQSSALCTTNRSRCVMMPLCVYSASSCGFRLARPAGNSENTCCTCCCFCSLFFSVCSDFASRLSDNSLLLLLNEAVGQLAIGSGSAVGGASIRLLLLMASQQELRVHRCLLSFRGQCLILTMKKL